MHACAPTEDFLCADNIYPPQQPPIDETTLIATYTKQPTSQRWQIFKYYSIMIILFLFLPGAITNMSVLIGPWKLPTIKGLLRSSQYATLPTSPRLLDLGKHVGTFTPSRLRWKWSQYSNFQQQSFLPFTTRRSQNVPMPPPEWNRVLPMF